MEFVHKSVLLEESINWLITDKDGIYVDCTMGGAGPVSYTHLDVYKRQPVYRYYRAGRNGNSCA